MKLSNFLCFAFLASLAACAAKETDDTATMAAADLSAVTPAQVSEVEPNNDEAQATPLPSTDSVAVGTVSPGDVDYWTVDIGANVRGWACQLEANRTHGLALDMLMNGKTFRAYESGDGFTLPPNFTPGEPIVFKFSTIAGDGGIPGPITYRFTQQLHY